jgi:hypothetical protein
MICGTPDIDIELLKQHTIYEGYTSTSRTVIYFWNVLKTFTPHERTLFLKFVWGRSRLPVTEEAFSNPMKIQKLDRSNPDSVLPLSHTCFFSIEIPAYTSKQILKEKLLYSILHCRAIDTDYTSTAIQGRDSNW